MNNRMNVLVIAANCLIVSNVLREHQFNVVERMDVPFDDDCRADFSYDFQKEHHDYNLRAPTTNFDRLQQRRKQLAINFNKKRSKATPKGARNRQKRFIHTSR